MGRSIVLSLKVLVVTLGGGDGRIKAMRVSTNCCQSDVK